MVAPYPAAAALRRRAARMEANGDVFPDNANAINPRGQAVAQQRRRRQRSPHPEQHQPPRLSTLYCLASLFLALLAIVTSSTPTIHSSTLEGQDKDIMSVENVARAAAAGIAVKKLQQDDSKYFFKTLQLLFSQEYDEQDVQQQPHRSLPPFFRWMLPPVKEESLGLPRTNPLLVLLKRFVDPSLLKPQPSTLTDIIDKILTSTPRILAIANLLLALTYLLHSAVANLFLGSFPIIPEDTRSWAGRERLGGFLVFKLLLISAVVAPDTLDLLILLSWYTLLSFLRSLAHLAAATTAHTSQSGLPPRRGVLHLLLTVLGSDFLAASMCVALFHGAGWGMVLLLTCDCALLAVDVLGHILQHASQVFEETHSHAIRQLEERQIELHATLQQRQQQREENQSEEEESRQLDRRMEVLEGTHARRVGILDGVIFGLQLLAYGLTVAHFLHIWSLHGLQFTLIDGVLALHLHSALAAAGKKIAERRNLNRIARDLDGLFEDAPEPDMRKAGDVCCICLVTMTTGNVKKVGCGHLYHTHCLREVVERARSIEAAKCPLCRASVLDGRPVTTTPVSNVPNNNAAVDGNAVAAVDGNAQQQPRAAGGEPAPLPLPQGPGEHALFRFSTENILPSWLPLPAFSFEVVRRPPLAVGANAEAPPPNRPSFLRRLFILIGVIPMSAEEEAMYVDQLVDMFPQYDRADLLRELRERGSSEAVVEAILMGIFSGVPRGGNLVQQRRIEATEQDEAAVQQ